MRFKKIYKLLKKYYYQKVLKRKYYRYGKCKMCGRCCKNIYVRHGNNTIKSEEEFNELKKIDSYSFYQHISVIGKDDFGLIFECNKFDDITKKCKDHKNRPPIGRNYPSEQIFTFGACLHEDCGYRFEPIESFEEIYLKISKKPVKNFDEYLM